MSSTGLTAAQFTGQIVAHGMTGGVLASVQGGKFGHGFASAGFTKAANPMIGLAGGPMAQGTAAALVGGTASVMTGGKFANGAVTAAFSYAFGRMAERGRGGGLQARRRSADGGVAGGDDTFADISQYNKVATALDVVFETCPAAYECDIPSQFSIEDLGVGPLAGTNTYTRHITFNSRALDFSQPYGAQLFLGAAYHETMHRGDSFPTRFVDGFVDGLDGMFGSGMSTVNHDLIYSRSNDLSIRYIDAYMDRLRALRSGR